MGFSCLFFMKHRIFILLCCAFLITLSSCEKESEPIVDDTTTVETKALREQYSEQVQGSWMSVVESELTYLEQHYTFGDDGKLTGHVLLKSRERVMVNGESVLTDWEIVVDEDVTGTWDLRYISSLQKNTLHMKVNSEYAFQGVIEFVSVSDSFLEITSPFAIGRIIRMQRVTD
jgi:hypothetical protein